MDKNEDRALLPAAKMVKIRTGCSTGKLDRFESLRAVCIMTLRSFDQIAAEHNLTSAQWFCLRILSQEGVGNCNKLANRLGYDAGAMTRLLDTLVNRGLVQRQRSETDRRIVELALTTEAIPLVLELEEKLDDFASL